MNNHIVKAYDEDLNTLQALIRHMGELTLEQIRKATQSTLEHNDTLAQDVIDHDFEINLLETKVDKLATRILALRQPVASDLRMVVAALKISNQVERIADYASNIAKRSIMLKDRRSTLLVEGLLPLVETPQQMFEKAITAFTTYDVKLAFHVWLMDQDVDKLYNVYLHQLFNEMIADSKNIEPCTQFLFIAKNIERIGDQSQNIAEAVYTMVMGKPFKESDVINHVSHI